MTKHWRQLFIIATLAAGTLLLFAQAASAKWTWLPS